MDRKKIATVLFVTSLAGIAALLFLYLLLFGTNVKVGDKPAVILIPAESTYESALDSVEANLDIRNHGVFRWIAERKNYKSHVIPGRYMIEKDMSYNTLINILRSGKQTSVRITFNNIRTLEELAGKVGGRIETDSLQLITFLSESSNYDEDGFTPETVISVFLPDTYEFYWSTSAEGFYERMLSEYRRFWNSERQKKAKAKGLTPVEVSILASITDYEAAREDEKPRIAGVYLNRLKRGIPLQADPTVKFALNDFSITRVLSKHLRIDSPYNTYKYKGLPPGPIGCPSIGGLEAVLNAEEHDYIYFVARADFSGYHNFSRTLAEHNRYAALYRQELNKRKIFR